MRRSDCRAFTLVELLAVTAVIGVLLAFLLPAVLTALESARQINCGSNLRQLALALQSYEGSHGLLPPGRDGRHTHNHSWATAVLPHLELQNVFDRYDWNKAWNDPSPGPDGSSNLEIAETPLAIFRCSSAGSTFPGATDYGGNYGSSLSGLPKGFAAGRAWSSGVMIPLSVAAFARPMDYLISFSHISDGTGQTFMLLEDAGRGPQVGGHWANGHQCLAHEYPSVNVSHYNGIFSHHPQGANVAAADAAVHFLPMITDGYLIGALSTRANGEIGMIEDPG